MTYEQFEEIAQEAFDMLPKKFRNNVENVQIVIEDYPSEDAQKKARASKYSLLGLYQGIPLTQRGTWYGASAVVPDKITLYKKNIEAVCNDETELRLRIMEVLYHELGHYFGMNEQQVRDAMKRFM